MDQTGFFPALLEAISAVYQAEADPQGPHTAKTLTVTPSPVAFDPVPPCVLDQGIRTVLASSDHPAARAALKAHDLLPWGSNPVEGNTESSIAAMISVATLLGPEGPIPAPDVRLGLVYMRPESYYPLHLHDADETYAIIAGQALWTAGDDVRMRGAGDMIHHPSLMPHAFRTGPEGFLAIWRWSGDINTHSYAFTEDQALQLQV
ncbi:Cupin domain protein [Roseovarius gaetbuli]|uniref:Cupin domain protein n=1 Tax=Roseovarius gaetbuli TaxID=1356575 RepID=A0A1X7A6R9_9RHOB|nr:dimethylsulfonioproprionate lyase family protein [Roseovarius gaetbuli]SLN71594.1 Cupin domain protein [Roseovarius gaetbuli]